MYASLDTTRGNVTIARRRRADDGKWRDKRAATEAHLWGMVRDALNDDGNTNRYVWTLTRPHKYALTGMPFALSRGRNRDEMVLDSDYAIRDVRALYNTGNPVTLTYIYVRDRG